MRHRTERSIALWGGTLVSAGHRTEDAVVHIAAGRVASVFRRGAAPLPQDSIHLDVTGCFVLPGFIDTHIHGCMGDDVMNCGAAGLARMARNLCQYGVTGFFPTTLSAAHEEIVAAMQACQAASSLEQASDQPGGARILGIHIEGPFINPVRKGAQPPEGIRDPDLDECRDYLSAAGGLARLMTFAPELPGADDLIRLLLDSGVIPSMGHSDADYKAGARAIKLGASHCTHLFNQMPPLQHRDPGLVTACLNEPDVTVELITDGIHIAPEIVRLAACHKGWSRVSLITDAMSALGMPDGPYRLGSHHVTVSCGRCSLNDGTLAGSVHRMDRALANTLEYTGMPIEEISRMASEVPARAARMSDRKGTLEPGMDADIVVLKEGVVQTTLVEGSVVYQRAESPVFN